VYGGAKSGRCSKIHAAIEAVNIISLCIDVVVEVGCKRQKWVK
jgi:hypothetical protein